MKYQLLSRVQRQQILDMRLKGYTFHSISEELKINLKTVQSVKSIDRKRSNYGSLIQSFINYYHNNEQKWEDTLFNIQDEKQRKKKLKKFLKSEASNPNSQEIKREIEKLEMNGRCQNQFSRRILDEVTEKVYDLIKNRREKILQESILETGEESLSGICTQLQCGYDQDSQMLFEDWIPMDF